MRNSLFKVKLFSGLFLALIFTSSSYTFVSASRNETPLRSPRNEQRVEQRQIRITALRRERIRSFFSKMITKIEASSERLQKLIDRVQNRIDSIKKDNSNIDTAKAEASLKLAQEALKNANAEIIKLKALFETAIISDDPKTNFETVRKSLKTIQNNLKEAKKNLVLTIGELRGLRIGDNNE